MARPSLRRRTRVLVIDGEVHVIAERRREGIVTIRLRGAEATRAVQVLDDAQYEIAVGVLGPRRPPP